MKYLNLTKDFNPFNTDDCDDFLEYEFFTFPGGEPHFRILDQYNENQDVFISIRIQSFNDLGKLLVAYEALDQSGWLNQKWLFLPYFPGARQDRRMVEGDCLTVKVYADIINSMGFDEVRIFDPHSDVTPALINNSTPVYNYEFAFRALTDIFINNKDCKNRCVLVSPDAGSIKKMYDLNKKLKLPWVQGGKHRNIENGKIDCFSVNTTNLDKNDCIIIDDICDGGGTFIGLAKELKKKNAGDLYLIVSHGIFSKGFKELRKYFKAIYTTDSWSSNYSMEIPEIEKGSEIVNIINFKDFIKIYDYDEN